MTDDVTKIVVQRGTDCIGVSISFVLLPSPPHTTLQYWVDKAKELGILG